MIITTESIEDSKPEYFARLIQRLTKTNGSNVGVTFEIVEHSRKEDFVFSFANKRDFKICWSYVYGFFYGSKMEDHIEEMLKNIGNDGSKFFRARMKAIN